jgi:hypothetical protein
MAPREMNKPTIESAIICMLTIPTGVMLGFKVKTE